MVEHTDGAAIRRFERDDLDEIVTRTAQAEQ
jgi:hypothetical protein